MIRLIISLIRGIYKFVRYILLFFYGRLTLFLKNIYKSKKLYSESKRINNLSVIRGKSHIDVNDEIY